MTQYPRRESWDELEDQWYRFTNRIVQARSAAASLEQITPSEAERHIDAIEEPLNAILTQLSLETAYVHKKHFEFSPEYNAAVIVLGQIEEIREHVTGNTHINPALILGHLQQCAPILEPIFKLFNEE